MRVSPRNPTTDSLQCFDTVGWAAGMASGLWKIWGWWRWALVSPDGVAPSQMVSLSASVNRLRRCVVVVIETRVWTDWRKHFWTLYEFHSILCSMLCRIPPSLRMTYNATGARLCVCRRHDIEFRLHRWLLVIRKCWVFNATDRHCNAQCCCSGRITQVRQP